MEDQPEETMATPGVIDKYKDAGKIANCNILDYGRRLRTDPRPPQGRREGC